MASVGLGGQNEYAYDTVPTNSLGMYEISFFDKRSSFGVKKVLTDIRTDTFPNYIYRFASQATLHN